MRMHNHRNLVTGPVHDCRWTEATHQTYMHVSLSSVYLIYYHDANFLQVWLFVVAASFYSVSFTSLQVLSVYAAMSLLIARHSGSDSFDMRSQCGKYI